MTIQNKDMFFDTREHHVVITPDAHEIVTLQLGINTTHIFYIANEGWRIIHNHNIKTEAMTQELIEKSTKAITENLHKPDCKIIL